MFDMLLKNGMVVLEDEVADLSIGIKDGKIAAFISPETLVEAEKTYDASEMYVLPGAIDTHSHVTFCDEFSNGSKAAVAGGVTTLIEMPLSQRLPAAVNEDVYKERIHLGEAVCVGDFALWGGVQPDFLNQPEKLQTEGAAAFKVFMSYAGEEYKSFDDYSLIRLMNYASARGIRLGLHAENDSICNAYTKKNQSNGGGAESHSDSRPILSEMEAVNRACLYAHETGCAIHICHVSSPDVANLILNWRKKGVTVTYETCPHYLCMTHEDVARYGAYAKCNPPIRSEQDREGLWDLLRSGQLDCIGTDHATYSELQKETGSFWSAPGGFPGIDLMVPTLIDEGVLKRGVSWVQAAKVLASNPARIFGLSSRKGTIRVGMDADFALIHPNKPWTYNAANTFYGVKSEKYPYENKKFTSQVCATFVRGRMVFANGKILANEGYGKYINAKSVKEDNV